MAKINTLEELCEVKAKALEAQKNQKITILVCGGTGCKSSNSSLIVENLEEELAAENLTERVTVLMTGCFGFCEKGPIVKILPDNTFYTEVTPEDAKEIVRSHIVNGEKVERLLYKDQITGESIPDSKHMNFYKKQMRIALRNCGYIDPGEISQYIREDGYQALAKCLTTMEPKEVIQIVKDSGLRGRGGAGFPTGLKWEIASRYDADVKYVVCNADEGDPGAFMDRSILEGDPHSVVEAMAICGYAINA
ncbi:NAD(P)H-dependent oxidoreductase subunit E, partial [Anaerosporobacter sp.]